MHTQTVFLVVMLMLSSLSMRAQHLKLTNKETGTELIFLENTRVRARTEGFKRAGRMNIVDSAHIELRNRMIAVSDIVKIKKHPLVYVVIVDAILIIYGLAGSAYAFVTASMYGDPGLYFFGLVGIGYLTAGVLTPNILPAYYAVEWDYKIYE